MNEQAPAFPSPDARRQRLLKLLESQGEQTVEQLASRFDVSGMTIRRDLQELEARGGVTRTRGGAALSARVAFEFHFLERANRSATEKEAIAEAAAGLVQPGQKVLLDSSTTTLAIARRLRQMEDLTVITTSLPIASELFGLDHIEVILLGGSLRKDAADLTGALTEQALGLLRAEVAFLGADAVDDAGHACTGSMEVARMLQRMAQASDQAYAVADHTKIGQRALMRFADLNQWTGLITDPGVNASAIKTLNQRGVNVIVSPDNTNKQGAV